MESRRSFFCKVRDLGMQVENGSAASCWMASSLRVRLVPNFDGVASVGKGYLDVMFCFVPCIASISLVFFLSFSSSLTSSISPSTGSAFSVTSLLLPFLHSQFRVLLLSLLSLTRVSVDQIAFSLLDFSVIK